MWCSSWVSCFLIILCFLQLCVHFCALDGTFTSSGLYRLVLVWKGLHLWVDVQAQAGWGHQLRLLGTFCSLILPLGISWPRGSLLALVPACRHPHGGVLVSDAEVSRVITELGSKAWICTEHPQLWGPEHVYSWGGWQP